MNSYVFVYGSLRQHESNYHLLDGAKLVVEQAYVYGELWDTGFGYPAVVLSGQTKVYGEVYQVSEEQLHILDQLEGYNGPGQSNHYERIEQTVYTDHQSLTAQMYVYVERPENDTHIPSGDWKVERILDGNMNQPLIYFAYGSCMDTARFEEHDVDQLFENVLGHGLLDDYKMKFTYRAADGYGRADLVESKGSAVEGKLYEIGQEALEYLYVREGVGAGIYRPTFVNVEHRGERLQNVFTFTVVDKLAEEVAPPDWYLEEILRGAEKLVSEPYFQQLQQKRLLMVQ